MIIEPSLFMLILSVVNLMITYKVQAHDCKFFLEMSLDVLMCFLFKDESEIGLDAYVRGEENLTNWRARSWSLIEEHYKNQNKLLYIQEV